MYLQIIFIGLLIIILFIFLNNFRVNEKFSNYLFPIKGLEKECEKKGLKPAYLPTSCLNSNGNTVVFSPGLLFIFTGMISMVILIMVESKRLQMH